MVLNTNNSEHSVESHPKAVILHPTPKLYLTVLLMLGHEQHSKFKVRTVNYSSSFNMILNTNSEYSVESHPKAGFSVPTPKLYLYGIINGLGQYEQHPLKSKAQDGLIHSSSFNMILNNNSEYL
ncbi:hypothetical protein AVEN_198731-1 [Araneus ventricosus]|uniref:Uncharacterized protein n=1 Tax=Araneus ventricosus TaxID=182803 RepID=A0A4Y2RGG7_ARAVE|nr:hypothetical protein AVEN_198731-1 [Araneus ventricosus]